MTKDEMIIVINNSRFAEFASRCEFSIGRESTVFDDKITGIANFFDFIKTNLSLWKEDAIYLRTRILYVIDSFTKLNEYFENQFVNDFNSEEYYAFDDWVEEFKLRIMKLHTFLLPHDHSASLFLLEKVKKGNDEFDGAFDFLTRQDFVSVASAEYFNGVLSAMLFEQGDLGAARVNQEDEISWKVLENQRSEFKKLIANIHSLADKSSTDFEEWSIRAENDFKDFYNKAELEISSLKKRYEETLKLKGPAAHWAARAQKLQAQGRWAILGLFFLVTVAVGAVFSLLWLSPEGVLLNFIENKASAIKWSIIFIVFVSLMAYGIRILHKVAFSAFHLARDAEEREQLAYVYLSLLNESAVDEKDRSLVLQAIFARADTGLLKDDASPTMPGGVVDKFFQK